MFNSRRSEIEIIGEILKLSRKGARKTEILYQGNLSYTQLQNYLSFLVKKDILEEKVMRNNSGKSHGIYKTTNKGNDLLMYINKILSYFK